MLLCLELPVVTALCTTSSAVWCGHVRMSPEMHKMSRCRDTCLHTCVEVRPSCCKERGTRLGWECQSQFLRSQPCSRLQWVVLPLDQRPICWPGDKSCLRDPSAGRKWHAQGTSPRHLRALAQVAWVVPPLTRALPSDALAAYPEASKEVTSGRLGSPARVSRAWVSRPRRRSGVRQASWVAVVRAASQEPSPRTSSRAWASRLRHRFRVRQASWAAIVRAASRPHVPSRVRPTSWVAVKHKSWVEGSQVCDDAGPPSAKVSIDIFFSVFIFSMVRCKLEMWILRPYIQCLI